MDEYKFPKRMCISDESEERWWIEGEYKYEYMQLRFEIRHWMANILSSSKENQFSP